MIVHDSYWVNGVFPFPCVSLIVFFQLERDFAVWRARKGLRPSSFFPEGATPDGIEGGSILSPYLIGDPRSGSLPFLPSLHSFSFSVLPWRMCSSVGLQGVGTMNGGGVLTRAEVENEVLSFIQSILFRCHPLVHLQLLLLLIRMEMVYHQFPYLRLFHLVELFFVDLSYEGSSFI